MSNQSIPDPADAVYAHEVPAERPWSRLLKRGQTLRIVDIEGQQAVDALLYCAEDPSERYSAQDTIAAQRARTAATRSSTAKITRDAEITGEAEGARPEWRRGAGAQRRAGEAAPAAEAGRALRPAGEWAVSCWLGARGEARRSSRTRRSSRGGGRGGVRRRTLFPRRPGRS